VVRRSGAVEQWPATVEAGELVAAPPAPGDGLRPGDRVSVAAGAVLDPWANTNAAASPELVVPPPAEPPTPGPPVEQPTPAGRP
jgi:hypothetical protein